MIVRQKLKFMQELTFAIKVECLHSTLLVKLLLHNCAGLNMQKHVNGAYKGSERFSRVENKSTYAHI